MSIHPLQSTNSESNTWRGEIFRDPPIRRHINQHAEPPFVVLKSYYVDILLTRHLQSMGFDLHPYKNLDNSFDWFAQQPEPIPSHRVDEVLLPHKPYLLRGGDLSVQHSPGEQSWLLILGRPADKLPPLAILINDKHSSDHATAC